MDKTAIIKHGYPGVFFEPVWLQVSSKDNHSSNLHAFKGMHYCCHFLQNEGGIVLKMQGHQVVFSFEKGSSTYVWWKGQCGLRFQAKTTIPVVCLQRNVLLISFYSEWMMHCFESARAPSRFLLRKGQTRTPPHVIKKRQVWLQISSKANHSSHASSIPSKECIIIIFFSRMNDALFLKM